ncbi:MAG: DUF3459 domain-containing protein [Candidatus Thorarchaeota archaeon]|nr:MAG: DUF3459 domain-containing protein [Candidatus Thorarchaeota archaeon]
MRLAHHLYLTTFLSLLQLQEIDPLPASSVDLFHSNRNHLVLIGSSYSQPITDERLRLYLSPDKREKRKESFPDSLLNCYKALLKLRKETPALHSGSLNLLPPFLFGNFLSYQRIYDEQVVQIWLNFSKKSGYVSEIGKNPKLLFSTIRDTDTLKGSKLYLKPYQGVVLEIFP